MGTYDRTGVLPKFFAAATNSAFGGTSGIKDANAGWFPQLESKVMACVDELMFFGYVYHKVL